MSFCILILRFFIMLFSAQTEFFRLNYTFRFLNFTFFHFFNSNVFVVGSKSYFIILIKILFFYRGFSRKIQKACAKIKRLILKIGGFIKVLCARVAFPGIAMWVAFFQRNLFAIKFVVSNIFLSLRQMRFICKNIKSKKSL